MADTPKFELPEIPDGTSDSYVLYNEAMRRIEALLHASVIDRDLDAAPGSPDDGDCYIVAATPSSADEWNGHDSEIAYYESTAWKFITPVAGLRVYVQDEDIFVYWRDDSDEWVEEGSSGAAS